MLFIKIQILSNIAPPYHPTQAGPACTVAHQNQNNNSYWTSGFHPLIAILTPLPNPPSHPSHSTWIRQKGNSKTAISINMCWAGLLGLGLSSCQSACKFINCMLCLVFGWVWFGLVRWCWRGDAIETHPPPYLSPWGLVFRSQLGVINFLQFFPLNWRWQGFRSLCGGNIHRVHCIVCGKELKFQQEKCFVVYI